MSSSKFQEHLASLNTAVCDIIYVELLSAATISPLGPGLNIININIQLSLGVQTPQLLSKL